MSSSATASAQYVAVSDDGSKIAFCANDAYVVPVVDGVPGTAEKASVDASGGALNGPAEQTALSGDGSVLAYSSAATNAVAGDLNGEVDVFARDLSAGTNALVSLTGSGGQANWGSLFPSVDLTGRHIAFQSYADNLSASDNDAVMNLYVRDGQTSSTALVNGYRNASSYGLELTGAGTSGVFLTSATDLGVSDANGQIDVVRWNGGSSYTVVSAVPAGTATGNGASDAAAISDDGSVIAFSSAASNISAGDLNGAADVFVWTAADGVVRVDNAPGGAQLNGASVLIDVSGDGRFVLYQTTATNASSGPGLYVRDLAEGAEPVFVASTSSTDAKLGASGDFVAVSTTVDLGADGDSLADVYLAVHDFAAPSSSASVSPVYDSGGGPTVSATDNHPGAVVHWSYDGQAPESAASPAVAAVPSAAGAHTLTYWAVDAAGNVGRYHSVPVLVGDTRAPESTCGVVPASFDGTATITLVATDEPIGTGVSGVAGIEWWTDPEGYASGVSVGSSATVAVARTGARTLYWRAHDVAGNYETTRSVSFGVRDVSPPSVDVQAQDEYNDVATVPLFVDDGFTGAGPVAVEYTLDGSGAREATFSADPGNGWGTGTIVVSGLGPHAVQVRAKDAADNWSGWVSASFTIVDGLKPSVSIETKGKGPGESTLVHVGGSDGGSSPSGVASLEWSIDGGDLQTVSAAETTVTVPDYPGRTLTYRAVDAAGNVSATGSSWIAVADGRAPSVTLTVDYGATPIRASFSATDPVPGSGVERVRWSENGLPPAQVMGSSAYAEFSEPGTNTLEVWAYDKDGNESAHETTEIVVPGDDGGGGGGGGGLELGGLVANGGRLWSTTASLGLSIEATGAASMRFAFSYGGLSSATWVPYSAVATVVAPGPGEWPVWVQVRDGDGVTAELCTADPQTRVDLVAPVTTSNASETGHGWQAGDEITFAADDPATVAFSASGVSATHFRVNGGAPQQGSSFVLPAAGTYTIAWWSEDIAGNVETAHEKTLDARASASLALGLSATTVTYPTKTTVTATLRGAQSLSALPGRSVAVQWSANGGTGWATVQTLVTGIGGTASWAAGPLQTGYYRLVFAGDGGYRGVTTAARTVTVRPYLFTPIASVTTVKKGVAFRLSGLVRPKHTAGMTFRCLRYESGTWKLRKTVYVKYATYDSITTKVYQTTSLPYTGTWRIMTYHSDTQHASPLYSGYRKIVVK